MKQEKLPSPSNDWPITVNDAIGAWFHAASSTAEDKLAVVRNVALAWGGECLSDIYRHSRIPLLFRCADGHIFTRTASKLVKGYFCSVCNGRRAKKLQQWQGWASLQGWTCLSEHYISSCTPLHWRCEHGHEWMATPSALRITTGCPRCHGRRRRHSIASMQALAKARGGACLSSEYINTHHKLAWICHRGHHWMATPNSAIRGHWCKQCDIIERSGKRYKKRLKYEPG